MAKRKLCNYANASNETTRAEAIYQRGQFYIVQNNNRLKDRRRYGVYLNDSLLGLGGSLVRLKRFVNDMYTAFPFAVDVNDSMTDKVRKLGKRAQLQLRPSMQPSKAEPKPAAKRTRRKKNQASKPKSTPAAESVKAAESKAAALPTMSAAQRRLVDQTIERARTGEQVQQVIQFIDQHKPTPAVNRLRDKAVAKRDRLRKPQQQRLF